jgi:hypothetical protein
MDAARPTGPPVPLATQPKGPLRHHLLRVLCVVNRILPPIPIIAVCFRPGAAIGKNRQSSYAFCVDGTVTTSRPRSLDS